MALLSLERPRGVKKVSWLTLLGIVLVPLAIGGLLVWALWNPTDRLDQITAAVVNEDTPVEINGQTVPLGRQLAAGLVTGGTETTATSSPTPVPNVSGSDSSGNFTWVLTDKDDAAQGLADGTYATVVTIPPSSRPPPPPTPETPQRRRRRRSTSRRATRRSSSTTPSRRPSPARPRRS